MLYSVVYIHRGTIDAKFKLSVMHTDVSVCVVGVCDTKYRSAYIRINGVPVSSDAIATTKLAFTKDNVFN